MFMCTKEQKKNSDRVFRGQVFTGIVNYNIFNLSGFLDCCMGERTINNFLMKKYMQESLQER